MQGALPVRDGEPDAAARARTTLRSIRSRLDRGAPHPFALLFPESRYRFLSRATDSCRRYADSRRVRRAL